MPQIDKFQRVTMHPWVWWAVVRKAVEAFTSGGDLSELTRLKASDFLKAFSSKFDAESAVVSSPYVILNPRAIKEIRERNEEILREDPVYGKWAESVRDPSTGIVKRMGYNPLPNQDLRESLDLKPGVVTFCVEAVVASAKRVDIDNSNASGMIDALSALRTAPEVEVPHLDPKEAR